MVVLSLFDGVSSGRLALENLGFSVDEYYASEIDPYAIKISKSNWKGVIHIGDVSKVHFKNGTLITEHGEYDVGRIDLLIAGSPCQGFSFAGKQLNFDDPRSKLYFEFLRILKEVKPTWWLLENVSMKEEYEDQITLDLNVWPIRINSSAFSAQNRERIYWTNINPPLTYGCYDIKTRSDSPILIDVVGSGHVYTLPRGYNKGGARYCEKSPCITTSSWQHNHFVVENGMHRKFTPEECEKLQTLPVGYTSCVSDNQRYKAIGNGWTIKVIEHLLKDIPMTYTVNKHHSEEVV